MRGDVGAAGARTAGGVGGGAAGGCGGAQGETAGGGPPAEGRIAARVASDRVGPVSADRATGSSAGATGTGPDVRAGCCSPGVDADGPR
ncbi:hypothetical protein Misp05_58830 [Micromonospora sp. NBRC 107095]|nr:hypothetical protein Misp05_58830 [Micromonospora sp. NBRC 107095]